MAAFSSPAVARAQQLMMRNCREQGVRVIAELGLAQFGGATLCAKLRPSFRLPACPSAVRKLLTGSDGLTTRTCDRDVKLVRAHGWQSMLIQMAPRSWVSPRLSAVGTCICSQTLRAQAVAFKPAVHRTHRTRSIVEIASPVRDPASIPLNLCCLDTRVVLSCTENSLWSDFARLYRTGKAVYGPERPRIACVGRDASSRGSSG